MSMTVTATTMAMTAAAMAFAVAVTVMIAVNSRIISQFACQESIYGFISTALNTAVQGNACLGQSILGTTANAAANQGAYVLLLQEGSQGTMADTVAGENMGFLDLIVLNGVNLELFRMAKVLENLTVVIGNCKFHRAVASFLR